MFGRTTARVLAGLGAALVMTLTGACGSGDPLTEAGAKAGVDLMIPQAQAALEGAGFKNVTVTSESETENGKTFTVVSAVVGLDQLKSGCSLNYETRVTNLGLYFDEVITPQKPEGIEVKGAARNDVTPKGAFSYVLANHPACLVPGAKAPTS